MKKIILLMTAGMALLASGCSNDEIVDAAKGQAIAFTNPFVNKTGRAVDLVISNIGDCYLWGSSSASNAFIFDREKLTVTTNSVRYSPDRYWTEGTDYHFMAFASAYNSGKSGTDDIETGWTFDPIAVPTDNGPFGKLTFNNTTANGLEDVVYATNDVSTTGKDIAAMEPVPLVFKHALTRLCFTFTNSMGNNYWLKISNVIVTGLPAQGTLDFSHGERDMAWENSGELPPYTFPLTGSDAQEFYTGGMATTEFMFSLPGTKMFTVTFDIDLYYGKADETDMTNLVHVNKNELPYSHSVEVTHPLAIGTAYQFNATINSGNIQPGGLNPIMFTATVDNWTPGGRIDIESPTIVP